LIEQDGGNFTTKAGLHQQARADAREAAKEREEKARRKKKATNEIMLSIPIGNHEAIRKKNVYASNRTSRDP
jgi:hypothetical protein